jgi:hypothetical protein
MRKKHFTPLLFLVAVLAISSGTSYQSQILQYRVYQINGAEKKDVFAIKLIHSYGGIVNKSMNDVTDIDHKGLTIKNAGIYTGQFYFRSFYTIVDKTGFSDVILSRLDFEFSKFSGRKLAKSQAISVSQKTG